MRLVPWLVVLAAGGACTLPSADDYARGSSDAGVNDVPDPDAAALSDAGVSDGDAIAPLDGGGDGDAGACPASALYCNDFSGGAVADIGVVDLSSTGSLALVDGELVAKLDALPNPGRHVAEILHSLPSSARKATVEVDVNVSPATWPGGNMVILALEYDGAPSDHAEELYIDDESSITTTTNNETYVYDGAEQALARGKWVHVKLDADFTPHAGAFALSYDGTVVASRNGIDLSPSTNVGFKVRVGLRRNAGNSPTPALTVRYDNLVVSAE